MTLQRVTRLHTSQSCDHKEKAGDAEVTLATLSVIVMSPDVTPKSHSVFTACTAKTCPECEKRQQHVSVCVLFLACTRPRPGLCEERDSGAAGGTFWHQFWLCSLWGQLDTSESGYKPQIKLLFEPETGLLLTASRPSYHNSFACVLVQSRISHSGLHWKNGIIIIINKGRFCEVSHSTQNCSK